MAYAKAFFADKFANDEMILISIAKITLPIEGIDEMRAEAEREGYNFLDTLVEEWASGENRFEKRGELLMGCFEAGRLVGVGGLTIDPYAGSTNVGRIRRVYVLAEWRNRGVGRLLVQTLTERAREGFAAVRLRAESADAARLYERLGFTPIDDPNATHAITWRADITSL